jgi:hypothetical protein
MTYYIRHDSTAEGPTPSTGFYDTEKADYKIDFTHPDFIEVSEAEWQTRKKKSHVHNRQLVDPPPMTTDQLALRAQRIAEHHYEQSHKTILRFFEEAIPVPEEWKEYRQNLRNIALGNIKVTAVPSAPVLPFDP